MSATHSDITGEPNRTDAKPHPEAVSPNLSATRPKQWNYSISEEFPLLKLCSRLPSFDLGRIGNLITVDNALCNFVFVSTI